MSEEFIPFARSAISDAEIGEVVECLRSGWITTGPRTARFEKEFAEFLGARHALAVNSATSGMHLALDAAGVGPGDVVVTTPFTFTATAEVVRYMGADVAFADVDAATLNLDPQALGRALERHRGKVKVVLPVHFGGLACDMHAIGALAGAHGARIVEDAAHAFPTTWGGRLIGSFGWVTVFSFYATKTICTGEGGMVVTGDDEAARRMKVMRLHGINRDAWDRYTAKNAAWQYDVVAPGFKYNLTDVASAMGIHQLARAQELRRRRESIARRYDAGLAGLPLRLPAGAPAGEVHAWHLYTIRLDTARLDIDRARFIEEMRDAGVGTSVHFRPLHLMTYWREQYGLQPEDFPVATAAYERIVSLPIWPDMSDADVARVIGAVRGILARHAR
jgi:dTDP-4-amino-4,6-dideoxygalactose transaminase